jgi:hypothetical protein
MQFFPQMPMMRSMATPMATVVPMNPMVATAATPIAAAQQQQAQVIGDPYWQQIHAQQVRWVYCQQMVHCQQCQFHDQQLYYGPGDIGRPII